ncbi:TetR/AcrR family transcriptional regulator C-terminal domain-containing protein [Saccharopolyspora sp. HNM0983]|uniref:TetR/AcrR family transcriptional regulator C-terminal domain-containing protein n=1 Tax=Saccharopolyspora montiporae TaxID=2781240 RepID=A0A929B9N0_9PSEU|nr:TetR/AcrR family transcriptional regulator C-terminal domain-containing protein [Saccharopolyspora sp. HNM0983]MBE9374821.1 TetR/AcrR family transcriptional regulator C-terminal domain-containing protein [Saccharopolyspora sp. HNM0983]
MVLERSGHGDPERTLALLWRDPPETGKPGRKPGHSVEEIVQGAIRVADAEGLAAMSMVRLARELGIGTMSLYTYLPGKAELIDLMVDAALVERGLRWGPPPDGWRARIHRYADLTRRSYRSHPWLRQVSTVRPPLGPGLLEQREYLLEALSGIGLTEQHMADAADAVIAFVDATAALEVDDAQAEQTGLSGESWRKARRSFWANRFDETGYPAITRVWRSGGYDTDAAESTVRAHDFGLAQLLNGIEATITGRSTNDG